MFEKFHHWLIKLVVGNTPVMMNVTVHATDIKASKPTGVYHKCRIIKVGENVGKTNRRNA